ncbi:MAG: hypothetical protein FJ288_04595 [Planctomycetes bacterium]|nr:hypothetical protein [Planctomycetota bacterium]
MPWTIAALALAAVLLVPAAARAEAPASAPAAPPPAPAPGAAPRASEAPAAAPAPLPAPLLVKARSKPDSPWKEYPTRTLDQLPGFKPDAAPPPLTKYGGRADRKARPAGFFRVEKVGPRWWLVDPDGGLFIHAGVCAVRPGASAANKAALAQKFGSPDRWADAATRLLWAAGFNGAGAWSDADLLRSAPRPVAYTLIWNFMSSFAKKKGLATQKPGHTGYPNDCIFVFDPAFPAFCREQARALAATKDDAWLVGHFSDNEMPAPRDLLDRFLALDASDANFAPGRRAAEAWLAARKGGAASAKDADAEDREAFMGYVFERYFEITAAAIRGHDPNHLCLGSRFYSNEKRSPSVFRGAGKYLDVISVNYYGAWTPDPKTLADWTAWSGRPVMITEWYTKGADTPLKNSTGAGWIVPTQNDRGLFYQNYTLALLQSATVVGWHWFKYMDNDPEDLSTDPSNRDSNKGVVTIRYEPYDALLAHMRRLNHNIYALADYFDSRKGTP